jgi:hypothetical protein
MLMKMTVLVWRARRKEPGRRAVCAPDPGRSPAVPDESCLQAREQPLYLNGLIDGPFVDIVGVTRSIPVAPTIYLPEIALNRVSTNKRRVRCDLNLGQAGSACIPVSIQARRVIAD